MKDMDELEPQDNPNDVADEEQPAGDGVIRFFDPDSVDPEYTAEVRLTGKWTDGVQDVYGLKIFHREYGLVWEDPHCGTSPGFCNAKWVMIVNQRREEERARMEQENAE